IFRQLALSALYYITIPLQSTPLSSVVRQVSLRFSMVFSLVGAMTFGTNVNDGPNLKYVLGQTKELTGRASNTATVDRGYKERELVGDTRVLMPNRDSAYQK